TAVSACDLRDHLVELVSPARSEGDLRSLRCQVTGRLCAESGTATGDQHNLAFNSFVHDEPPTPLSVFHGGGHAFSCAETSVSRWRRPPSSGPRTLRFQTSRVPARTRTASRRGTEARGPLQSAY